MQSTGNAVILNKIAAFSSMNEDVESFLKNKAADFDKRDMGRTYLMFDDTGNLVAYFTLALKSVVFGNDVSNTLKKKIHGATSDIKSVPVILIGQLGKNFAVADKIKGTEILDSAFSFIYDTYKLVGSRICLIETLADETNKKVFDFYKEYGFKELQTDGTYIQMYKRLK
jgi:hypothetical protein